MSQFTMTRDIDHAIPALDAYLRSRDYTAECRRRIAIRIHNTGELSCCVPEYLDAEDLDAATEILIDALPAVTYASPEWAEPAGHITPTGAVAWDSTVTLTPDDILQADDDFPDPTPDQVVTHRPGYWESLQAAGIERLPVISGGAPDDDEPFEPTEADRAEYAAWSAQLDAARAWHDRNDFGAWLDANGGPRP